MLLLVDDRGLLRLRLHLELMLLQEFLVTDKGDL
jgi:hypothetical protein